MDLIAVDVTDLEKNAVRRGHLATLIGEGITVDELAHHFGTIGYEVLTSLGRRYARAYKGGAATEAATDPPPRPADLAASSASAHRERCPGVSVSGHCMADGAASTKYLSAQAYRRGPRRCAGSSTNSLRIGKAHRIVWTLVIKRRG